MGASNSKGVTVRVLNPDATPINVAVTGVTAAKPAVVSSTASVTENGLIYVPAGATSMPGIDGKWFEIVNVVPGTSFELLGSDTTDETYNAGTTPDMEAYDMSDTTIMCFATLTFNPATPTTISTATYCDPSATVPSPVVEAGTVDFTGYVDVSAEDYQLLPELYEGGLVHAFRVFMPNNGTLIFTGTVASFDLSVPLDGAIGYAGQIALSSRPRHLF
jgi:hypothetical protein